MTTAISDDLISAVREGRAVLFLGAGASRGAKNDKGDSIPLGADVAKELVESYLTKDYEGLDFRSAYDLSCSQRDVLTVQKYLFERLNPFFPADFHKLIPTFAWAGIVTTNYDLIVERSYAASARSNVQELITNTKDGDGSARKLDHKSLLYVKLHGCITRYHEILPPMVASTEQLIAFREGRQGQFTTFLEWAKTKTLVFVGYAFGDNNLRTLFDEIIKEGDNRPRHFIVGPGVLPAVQTYWADRRVTAISLNFEQLLDGLDHAIPKSKRALSSLAAGTVGATPFTKFISRSTSAEPPSIKAYLGALIEHVHPEFEVPLADAKQFYRGFNQGWYPIQSDLDVRQSVTADILTDHILTMGSGVKFILLKGHAGSGKTIALRRIAWETGKKYQKLCFFVTRQHVIDVERFQEIFSLTDLPVFLFVDNVADHQGPLVELMTFATRQRVSLCVIGVVSFNIWNTTCDDLEPHVSQEYEMRYLSEDGITGLIDKLEVHDCLGYLKTLTREQKRHELREVHGRQILVALLEATNGMPLVEIISSEYNGIFPPEAKLLYLDVCSLHRFGPPVRAGIISRIHNIQFEEFEDKFFKPLEQIVKVRKDPKSRDLVYEARHSYIARVVYEIALPGEDARFDNLARVLSKLNVSFSSDMDAMAQLLRAENIQRTLYDAEKGRRIYDIALKEVGRKPFILHQRGVYELHVATEAIGLNAAQGFLEEALEEETFNKSIRHSLAEVDLRRSRMAKDELERQSWRQSAESRATALTGGLSSYPYHTLMKAAVDEVKDALTAVQNSDSDTSVLRLGEAIQKAESTLTKGLKKFPNDSRLLGEEGNLSQALADVGRAETAFHKAFMTNPRSSLLAKRLLRIYRAKGAWDDALKILRKALEENSGSQDLHFEFAMVLIEMSPDADQTAGDQVLYHLRRSFVPGDNNHQAQFWYARQLVLMDKNEDARLMFEMLGHIKVPSTDRNQVRGIIKTADGRSATLDGNVIVVKSSYILVQCAKPNVRAFCQLREVSEDDAKLLRVGDRMTFEMGFTLRGPVAVKAKLGR